MIERPSGDVTRLLVDWSNGDEQALERLMPLVYDDLHRRAARYLQGERVDHTLQATALVHEAYLRLVDQRRVQWRNTLHFVALAAQMMRRVLTDHARGHRSAKRGGESSKISLEGAPELPAPVQPDVLVVDEALTRLAEFDPGLAQVVELRFFGGMTIEEVAEYLGVSVPTVVRRWRSAKAQLYRDITGGEADGA